MIGYVMLGTNNLRNAVNFFDKVLEPLGLYRSELDNNYAGYAKKKAGSDIEFYVTKPFNGKKATVGNGSMVSFLVTDKSQVDHFHDIALKNGAINEGNPGLRPSDGIIYYGYIRDLDGNKICVYAKL